VPKLSRTQALLRSTGQRRLPNPDPCGWPHFEMPVYLDDELTQKAAALRVTKQFPVLTAHRQAGYQIADAKDIRRNKCCGSLE